METKDILQAVEPVLDKFKNEVNDSVNKVKTEGNEAATKAATEAVDKVKEEITKRVDELEAKAQRTQLGAGQVKSFEAEIEEKLTENQAKLKSQGGERFTVELSRKAVGNMGSSASLTGSYFVAPTVVPGIVMQPYNVVHMRDILSTGTTNSNIIRHLRDNGGEGGPTTVAEAATKPQMDRDLSIVDAPVRKIATYLRVPEEMIEDIPFLTSFLTNIGVEEVKAVEDAQILYGDGTGQNLTGIATSGSFTAFAAGSTIVTAPNRFSVLGMSSTQMKLAKRNPTYHLINPRDFFELSETKDDTGNYILRGGGNGILPVDQNGVQIISMNQVAAGDFITVDSRAAQIFYRSNINVRFYEQDQDNAIKNMVTIVIEERLALPIYFTTGIIKGTFSAGITDLTS